MFFKKIDNPIGLDLSDLSVKLVQLEKKSTGLEVSAFSDVLLPAGMVEHDVIQNPSNLIAFLKDLFNNRSNHSGKLRGRSIVASVPESKAFVRVIKLPNLKPEELVTAVPIEAEQYIPLPIEDVQVDWNVIREEPDGLRVFITATPKDYIQSLLEVFRGADLVVQSLEAESAAIVRTLLMRGPETPGTLILDMDASRTSLIVYGDNSIQFTSSIPIAGNAITEAIAQRLSVEKPEAEHIKRLHGIPLYASSQEKVSAETGKVLSEITQAIDPVLNNLFDEIKNTIKFHEQHNEAKNPQSLLIQQIVLCGGTSKLPNLPDYLQAKIGADPEFTSRKIKVLHGNAWQNFPNLKQPPFSRREALSYSTAIGLALRNYIK